MMTSRSGRMDEESLSLLCCFCMNPIKGTIVEALGKTWHPEHFRCEECKRPIEEARFHVKDGLPYCEPDYTRLFLSLCSLCNLPIRDVVIVGLGKTWHRDHFQCADCKTELVGGHYEREKQAYCPSCYERIFCSLCFRCQKPIAQTALYALGEKWHEQCFLCTSCKNPIQDNTFDILHGQPYCSECFKNYVKEHAPPEQERPIETPDIDL